MTKQIIYILYLYHKFKNMSIKINNLCGLVLKYTNEVVIKLFSIPLFITTPHVKIEFDRLDTNSPKEINFIKLHFYSETEAHHDLTSTQAWIVGSV